VRRRDFITLVGGAAAVPALARGQERIRRVATLSPLAETATEGRARHAAFLQAFQQLGWIDGQNVQIEARWGTSDLGVMRKQAAELVALSPDVIVAGGNAAVPVLQASRSIPVVFVNAVDPVGAGIANSLPRPGGNATGFTLFEYSMSGKWLELLKEISPNVTRVAVLRDSTAPSGLGQFAAIQSAATVLKMDVRPINVPDGKEIERAIAAFASGPNGGLIVAAGASVGRYRDLIIGRAGRHKLPTVYHQKFFVTEGGLLSYGADIVDQFRRAASYVDRILKGEMPADLPVQAPTKYELAINLKTAKALGLAVPPTLLARADEVVE
jgi:putative ABC transport system substrate-binding protein